MTFVMDSFPFAFRGNLYFTVILSHWKTIEMKWLANMKKLEKISI